MPPSAKTLNLAELSVLEQAFASDPSSDAYRPLTEAYLAAGRFMEAMVVCKKGVKAHPDDPSARVLLARVYADQGKDRRGLEEIQTVLTGYPTFAAALRLAGIMYLRLGERSAGETALRKAYEVSPDDPETRATLSHFNVQVQSPVAPKASMPYVSTTAAPVAPREKEPAGATAVAPASVAFQKPAGERARNVAISEALAEQYKTREFTIVAGLKKPKNHRGTLFTTLALAGALAVALGGFAIYSKARKERIENIDRLIKETEPLIEKDTPAGYAEAAKKAAEILVADPHSVAGRAFLAYADSILVFEHGGGDPEKNAALAQIDAAHTARQHHSHLLAAEAYLRAYAGDLSGAEDLLRGPLESETVESPLKEGALGAILLKSGDLDAAREKLSPAQKAAPGDVRLAFLLAEQFRRRGEGYEVQALGLYDYALHLEKDHLGSILGKGLVLLARGQADEAERAAELVLAPSAQASKPQQAIATAIRAGVLAAAGKATEAASAEAEAAKLDPASADIPHLVGWRRLRDRDVKGAIDAFQNAISLEPRRVALYIDLVRAELAQDGGAKTAIETAKKAVARVGEAPRLVMLLGQAYQASGDLDLAQGQFQKAIQLGGKFPDARVALARLYRLRSNVPGALVELNQAIDEYGRAGGGAAEAYVEMAEVERARGAKPAVLSDLYEKALSTDPASCDALWGSAKLEYDTKKPSETARTRIESYKKLCGKAPHADEAAKLLGT